MAETYFDENVVPSLTGAGYTTEELTFNSEYFTYDDGGYCQIGNIVIVNLRVTAVKATTAGTANTIAEGFPNPLRNTTLNNYLVTSRPDVAVYITPNNGFGSMRIATVSGSIPNNIAFHVSGVYLTTAPSIYIPPAFEVPVPVNLTIVSEMQSSCNFFRNNSYKLGRFVHITIGLNVTQNITGSGAKLLIADNPPVLYRDISTQSTTIVDIPSFDGHRIRVTPSGIYITAPIDAGQYTFSGMYISSN